MAKFWLKKMDLDEESATTIQYLKSFRNLVFTTIHNIIFTDFYFQGTYD